MTWVPARAVTIGFSVCCPVCTRPMLPHIGYLHLALAPRLAYHLWDRHPYEAAILKLWLNNPPDAWPVLEAGT